MDKGTELKGIIGHVNKDLEKEFEALGWIDEHIDWNCKKIEELKNQDKGVADIYDNENKMLVNIKQSLLKSQENEKILEILKPYFQGAIFPSAIYFHFSNKEFEQIKRWVECLKN